MRVFVFALACLVGGATQSAHGQSVMVDDFESYSAGGLPTGWIYVNKEGKRSSIRKHMSGRQKFTMAQEDGNKFVRAYTKGEALRISRLNDEHFSWDAGTHPRLQWQWRARQLPEGASEKDKNDTGGAVYVTFKKKDWLGRPRSIKYTYSSSLSPGATVSFSNVKVIVVSSGKNGTGTWKTVTRNVVEDYRRLFGEKPPKPVSVTLWSDSDNTGDVAEVDFDDIQLLK